MAMLQTHPDPTIQTIQIQTIRIQPSGSKPSRSNHPDHPGRDMRYSSRRRLEPDKGDLAALGVGETTGDVGDEPATGAASGDGVSTGTRGEGVSMGEGGSVGVGSGLGPGAGPGDAVDEEAGEVVGVGEATGLGSRAATATGCCDPGCCCPGGGERQHSEGMNSETTPRPSESQDHSPTWLLEGVGCRVMEEPHSCAWMPPTTMR